MLAVSQGEAEQTRLSRMTQDLVTPTEKNTRHRVVY